MISPLVCMDANTPSQSVYGHATWHLGVWPHHHYMSCTVVPRVTLAVVTRVTLTPLTLTFDLVDLNFDRPYLLHTNSFEVIFASLESYRRALCIDGVLKIIWDI
jgi:hypothetical protein